MLLLKLYAAPRKPRWDQIATVFQDRLIHRSYLWHRCTSSALIGRFPQTPPPTVSSHPISDQFCFTCSFSLSSASFPSSSSSFSSCCSWMCPLPLSCCPWPPGFCSSSLAPRAWWVSLGSGADPTSPSENRTPKQHVHLLQQSDAPLRLNWEQLIKLHSRNSTSEGHLVLKCKDSTVDLFYHQ